MRTRLLLAGAVLAVVPALPACSSTAPAPAPPGPLCGTQSAPVANGDYIVQSNEYASQSRQCLTLTGGTAFEVSESALQLPADGTPGGYPSIYQGCHWGQCTQGKLAGAAIQASALAPGALTTSWQTSQPGSGAYNVAYDVWFASKQRVTGQPDCTELMVWLNHNGPVQPYGHMIDASATVGGHEYQVWAGHRWWGGSTITYSLTTGTDSVSGLDLGVLAADAIQRGYLPGSCYLQDVEAGFEIWQGGAGLGTGAFSVTLTR